MGIVNLIAIGLLLAAAVKVLVDLRYFRKQREMSEKYDFYRLRSKLHREMLASESPRDYDELDAWLNEIIADLKGHAFGFTFFNNAVQQACDNLVQLYIEQGEAGLATWLDKLNSDASPVRRIERELYRLLLKAARRHSLILRIAMTSPGYRMIVGYHMLRALHRRIRTGRPPRFHVPTIETYSVMARHTHNRSAAA